MVYRDTGGGWGTGVRGDKEMTVTWQHEIAEGRFEASAAVANTAHRPFLVTAQVLFGAVMCTSGTQPPRLPCSYD